MFKRDPRTLLAGPIKALSLSLMLFGLPNVGTNPAAALCAPIPAGQTTLSVEQAGNFSAAIAELSRRGQVVIVAEGTPLRPRLPKAHAEKLTAPLPLEENIKALAAAYGYEIVYEEQRGLGGLLRRRNAEVYTLRKTYEDGRDLPAVTFEQCVRALEQFHRLAAAQGPQPPVDWQTDLVLDAYHSLTDEQRTQVVSDNGLTISSLDTGQQAKLRRMALHLYLGPSLRTVNEALGILKIFPTASFQDEPLPDGQPYFGYRASVGGQTQFYGIFGKVEDLYKEDSRTEDRAAAGPSLTQAKEKNASLTSLGEVAAALASRSNRSRGTDTASAGDTADYAVEKALAALPVTVVGAQNASAASLLNSLAQIYGLRVRQVSTGKQRQHLLTFPPLPRVEQPGDVPQALRALLPEPLRRAVHDGSENALREEIRRLGVLHQNTNDTETRARLMTQIQEQHQKTVRFRGREDALRKQAARFFHDAIKGTEAKRKTQLNRDRDAAGVPFAELTEEERGLAALWTMIDTLSLLKLNYPSNTPSPLLTSFRDLSLTGKVYERNGKQMVGLSLGLIDPQYGKMRSQGSIFDVSLNGRPGGPHYNKGEQK